MKLEPQHPPGQGNDDSGTVPPPSAGQPVAGHEGPSPSFPHITGYKIFRCINKGGQGEVYEAVQMSTGGPVAIKVLKRSLYHSAEAKRNLAQEIRLLVQLRQPHIIEVKDAGETSDGRLYFIMEFFPGVSLKEYVRKQKLTLVPALQLFRKVCEAIRFVHERGVVHLDLKPANILVDAQGTPKILDFGLARTLFTPHEMSQSDIVGTLPYMSPEQTHQVVADIDVRSDVYSLGVILYEMLVGQYPYPINGAMAEILERIAEARPMNPRVGWTRQLGIRPPPEAASSYECPIDFELEAIVLKTLAKDPADRYQTAGDLALNVQRYLEWKPVDPIVPNLPYVVFTRLRIFVRRHRILAFLLAVTMSITIAEYTCRALFGMVNPGFENLVTCLIPLPGPRFEHVRVIGVNEHTKMNELLDTEDVELVLDPPITVDNPENAAWLQRALKRTAHGRLMERLSDSGCRAVVWDMEFGEPEPGEVSADVLDRLHRAQDVFAEGARTLRAAGVDVIVGESDFLFGRTARQIRESVSAIGAAVGQFTDSEPWSLPLIVQRNAEAPLYSLALRGVIAYWFPSEESYVDLNWPLRKLTVSSTTRTDASFKQGPKFHVVELARQYDIEGEESRDEYEFGLTVGDHIGYVQVVLPPDSVLVGATLSYQEVFRLSPEAIRAKLQDKIMVVGGMNPETDHYDRHGAPSRSEPVWGCYGHAAVIDAIIHGTGMGSFSQTGEASLSALAGLLGGAVALFQPFSRRRRVYMLVAGSMVLVLGSLGIYWLLHFLWNPVVAILAYWIAGGTYPMVYRLGLGRRESS